MTTDATWLVVGANGFLGSNAGAFLEDKVAVIGAVRSRSSFPKPSSFHSIAECDITDSLSVDSVIRSINPDVVLNTAALASHELCEREPELAYQANVVGPRNLASTTAAVGARFIHISTDAVFDGARGNYNETDTPSPFSSYGQSKLAGELAVLEENPAALIARTNFFGWSPTGSRSILEFFVNALTRGELVSGYNDYIVSSIYTQDLMQILWDLNEVKASGVFHCVAGNALSKFDFGVAVADQFGLDSGLIQSSSSPAGTDGISRLRDLSLDTKKASQLLGRVLPTQEAGLQHAFSDRSELRNQILS